MSELTIEEKEILRLIITSEMNATKQEILEFAEELGKSKETDIAINAYARLALIRKKIGE